MMNKAGVSDSIHTVVGPFGTAEVQCEGWKEAVTGASELRSDGNGTQPTLDCYREKASSLAA